MECYCSLCLPAYCLDMWLWWWSGAWLILPDRPTWNFDSDDRGKFFPSSLYNGIQHYTALINCFIIQVNYRLILKNELVCFTEGVERSFQSVGDNKQTFKEEAANVFSHSGEKEEWCSPVGEKLYGQTGNWSSSHYVLLFQSQPTAVPRSVCHIHS